MHLILFLQGEAVQSLKNKKIVNIRFEKKKSLTSPLRKTLRLFFKPAMSFF